MSKIVAWIPVVLMFLSGCATTRDVPDAVEAPVARDTQQEAQKRLSQPVGKTLKRKIAVVRFTNESQYGRSLLRDKDLDALGKQAADTLINRLVESGRFLVFERLDLGKVESERELAKLTDDLVGVDALVIGSLTDFNRKTTGKRGFLSSTKLQTARAEVELRLVDARTGHVFFAASGQGEANTESGDIAGFGSRAGYDATLNDKAIGAAIGNVIDPIMNKLEERKWWTDILKIEGEQIYISGGKKQGVQVGDILTIMKRGDQVKSKQSGFNIDLPPKPVGKLKVISLFGDTETNQGAVGRITEKHFDSTDGLFVME